jgi:plastocyanin
MRHTMLFTFGLAVTTALLVFGGCGKSSSSPTGYSGGGGGGGGGTGSVVTISNMAYGPSPLTVAKGTTVTWKNNDSVAHTATADDASFDTGNIPANSTSSGVTFNTAGTFPYHCTYHSSMHGTITVN